MSGGGQQNISVAASKGEFDSTTTKRLKEIVLKQWPEYGNTDDMRLIFAGKQLQEAVGSKTMTLLDYKVKRLSTIQIVGRVHGGHDTAKLFTFPRPRSPTQERVHSRFSGSPLILSTSEPDVIYGYSEDDDPPRVRMSCRHFVSPTNLYRYCRSELEGKKCELRCPKCDSAWEYSEVRQAALLTSDECKYFESLLSQNHMREKIDINCCPRCKIVCERKDRGIVITNCPACTKQLGRPYEFCWHCGKEWSGPRNPRALKCADPGCEHPSLKAVRNAQMVTKYECTFPNIRACPTCGGIVEHTAAKCKFATCPQCKIPYCFLCLKTESECLKAKPGSWHSPCSVPVKPIQTEIPRWIK